MVELKYKSWRETPINVYMKIRDILKSEEPEDDVDNKIVYIISTLSGLDVDEVMDLSLLDFERLSAAAAYVFKPIRRMPVGIKRIDIDGQRYDVQTDFGQVTTAQYMDFTTFFRNPDKYYCNILTTFILPHGKRYNDGYDASELAKVFEEKMDIETAENASFFFANWSMRSIKLIQKLYMRKVRRMMRKTKDEVQKAKMMEILNTLQTQNILIDGLATLMR